MGQTLAPSRCPPRICVPRCGGGGRGGGGGLRVMWPGVEQNDHWIEESQRSGLALKPLRSGRMSHYEQPAASCCECVSVCVCVCVCVYVCVYVCMCMLGLYRCASRRQPVL